MEEVGGFFQTVGGIVDSRRHDGVQAVGGTADAIFQIVRGLTDEGLEQARGFVELVVRGGERHIHLADGIMRALVELREHIGARAGDEIAQFRRGLLEAVQCRGDGAFDMIDDVAGRSVETAGEDFSGIGNRQLDTRSGVGDANRRFEVLLVNGREHLSGGFSDARSGIVGPVLDREEDAVGGFLNPRGDEGCLFVEAGKDTAGRIVEAGDDRVGALADLTEQLAGGVLDTAGEIAAHGAELREHRIGGLINAGNELRAGSVEAARDIVCGRFDGGGDAEGRTVEMGHELGARLGDAIKIVRCHNLQAIGHQVTTLFNHLRGVEASPLDRRGDLVGRAFQVIGEVAGGGLDDVGQIGCLLLDLVGRGDAGALDGTRDILVDGGELVDGIAHGLGHAGFHVLHRAAEFDRIALQRAGDLAQLFDLAGELTGEVVEAGDHLGRDILHVRGLDTHFGAS